MAQVIQTPYGTTTRVTTRDLQAWQSGAALTLTTTAPEPVDYADVVDEPLNLPVSEPDPAEPGRSDLPVHTTTTDAGDFFITISTPDPLPPESELVTLARALASAEVVAAAADATFRDAFDRQQRAHEQLSTIKAKLRDILAAHLA